MRLVYFVLAAAVGGFGVLTIIRGNELLGTFEVGCGLVLLVLSRLAAIAKGLGKWRFELKDLFEGAERIDISYKTDFKETGADDE